MTRTTWVVRPLSAVATLATGAVLLLASCNVPSDDGRIREYEEGKNGVKVEVQRGSDPDNTEEVYLIKTTECDEGEYLRSCADADDYLVQQPGAVPGLNRTHNREDD